MKRILSKEEIDEAMESGYSTKQINEGYDIFTSDYMNGALHIERLDELMLFTSDEEAAIQAEKDGIAIIHDLPILDDDEDFGCFIDTPENRLIIKNHLKTRGLLWNDKE